MAKNSEENSLKFRGIIKNLSFYQIRTHYIIYKVFKKIFNGEDFKITSKEERKNFMVFIPTEVYLRAIKVARDSTVNEIIVRALNGLAKNQLIGSSYRYGEKEYIQQYFRLANSSGMIITPSVLGTELFLWSFGYLDIEVKDFLKEDLTFDDDSGIDIFYGSLPIIASKSQN